MKRVLLCIMALLFLCTGAHADTEALFEPPYTNLYNYCPSIFVEDGVTHIYYCTNISPNVIRDHVGYRTSADGQTYSDEAIVLYPDADKTVWDGIHTCDPEIVKGEFHWNGEVYNYLLGYLGCKTLDCEINEIGLAVAKEPGGPFIKLDHLNPFVHYEFDSSTDERRKVFQWGVGQVSMINMDKKGQIMMIYTRGDAVGTSLVCEKWDLSDLNDPQPIGGDDWKVTVPTRGAVGRDMKPSLLTNADFVYDGQNGQLYMVCDGAPTYLEGVDDPGSPTFISSNLRVLRFSQQCFPGEMEGFFVQDMYARWNTVKSIGKKDTGFPRNHNAGLLSDPYGWLADEEALQVFYAVSDVGKPSDSLWTYRIHQYTVPLK